MTNLLDEPTIHPLGHQGEYYLIKVTWQLHQIREKHPAKYLGCYGLVLKLRAEDLPFHHPDAETVHFDVGKAWKNHNCIEIVDSRKCPGCGELKRYDQDTWGNIAAGKGTLYGCELCALKVEVGRMDRIET